MSLWKSGFLYPYYFILANDCSSKLSLVKVFWTSCKIRAEKTSVGTWWWWCEEEHPQWKSIPYWLQHLLSLRSSHPAIVGCSHSIPFGNDYWKIWRNPCERNPTKDIPTAKSRQTSITLINEARLSNRKPTMDFPTQSLGHDENNDSSSLTNDLVSEMVRQ